MSTAETLGRRIQRLRLARGWRFQREFAQAVKLDPASMNQIERDKRRPKLATVETMARVLGVSRDYLLDGGAAPTDAATTEPREPLPGAASPQGEPTYARISRAPDPDLSEAISFAATELLLDISYALADILAARHEALARRQVANPRSGTTGGPHRYRGDR